MVLRQKISNFLIRKSSSDQCFMLIVSRVLADMLLIVDVCISNICSDSIVLWSSKISLLNQF